jgi:hypothetical protein
MILSRPYRAHPLHLARLPTSLRTRRYAQGSPLRVGVSFQLWPLAESRSRSAFGSGGELRRPGFQLREPRKPREPLEPDEVFEPVEPFDPLGRSGQLRRVLSTSIDPKFRVEEFRQFRAGATESRCEGRQDIPQRPSSKSRVLRPFSGSCSLPQPPSCDPPRLQREHHIPVDPVYSAAHRGSRE